MQKRHTEFEINMPFATQFCNLHVVSKFIICCDQIVMKVGDVQ